MTARLAARDDAAAGHARDDAAAGHARDDAAAGHAREDGVATVYACLGIVVLLAVTGLGLHLGAVTMARQRAETGADLAALAGAAKVLLGPDVSCSAVVRVAVANSVEVQSCSVIGTDVLVVVTASAGSGPFGGTATGRARAGPVEVVSDVVG